ncbi:primosomal protein N' [Cohnella cholangitidis]|uniref:Replication restart protein PriA n=1 Tax=Cohnella cholangitidis TaxID=2598458 RepID=A0A7G5BTH6_9BACL|nr:primosomal protein N' [Cohnella cholangitidis]QMV40260.1 primosomal protein N' [Cohnella cholangitidis]
MAVARVIVDVPSRDTDRTFDYLIPDRLVGWVEIGSRVAVPFGPRKLQGIVTGLAEDADVEYAKLKPLDDLLDAVPPLSPELVELGEWMSRRWLCPLTVALQAMLPAALKGRTEKYVFPAAGAVWSDEETAESGGLLLALLKGKPIKLTSLLQQYPEQGHLLKRWLRQGRLEERQRVEDQLSVKTVLTVFPALPEKLLQAVGSIPVRANKQREVARYLAEHNEPIAVTKLTEAAETTSSTIRSLAERGLVEIRSVTEDRDPYADRDFPASVPMELTPKQSAALAPIRSALDSRENKTFLLHGVTGSGKTEVYLQAIQRCLEMGREAIVLVPEIALTPQMVERFKSRFGARVAVLHSRLSNGERYDEWRKIREGRAQVAVGARSAIFAPFTSIGLIVIDEEHETSYKQEESPKYHARDVAVERARLHDAVVVLGSATPALETYEAAVYRGLETGLDGTEYIALPERVANRPLPGVRIVDMREELKLGNRAMFSRPLADAIRDRLEKREQIVLLLNRRGYATFVMCRSCGYTAACPHCEISLTYHRGSQNLRCHYCGYSEAEPKECPSCQSPHIRFFGTGTQKVEESLAATFPGIRVIRMDVDTTTEKGSHERWLAEFRERRADVLLGTQMVAKGLDFPYVTLVGVLAADAALRLPDFRASERTFQLLTQVAGRAGRHKLPGEVIIQTYDPEHESITYVQGHDYTGFVERALVLRKQLGYPPYGRLLSVTFSHESVPMLLSIGESFATGMREKAAALGIRKDFDMGGHAAMEVLGPVSSPIARLKDRYRFQCMVKYRGDVDASLLTSQVLAAIGEAVKRAGVQISVDVDPQMML